jgi:PAS domain S-box-containing protein
VGVSEPLVQASLLGEAIDNGPTAVFVADETMQYVAVNRYACDLLGYDRPELLKLRVTDVAAGGDAGGEFAEMVEAGIREGTTRLRRKDGSTVEFRYRAGTTIVAGLTVYVSVGSAGPS